MAAVTVVAVVLVAVSDILKVVVVALSDITVVEVAVTVEFGNVE